MKWCKQIFKLVGNGYICITVGLLLLCNINSRAQESVIFKGKLTDLSTNEPVPYADIALFSNDGKTFLKAATSDTGGSFLFNQVKPGAYLLKTSIIGYDGYSEELFISKGMNNNDVVISLKPAAINLKETYVVADRQKGKTENDKTIYYMTGKMVAASNNGLDIVRLIPGVRVDLYRRISLEGSSNVIILINGRERDNNSLSQLEPAQIDRVEIISAVSSKFDGDLTGAINIITKKPDNLGMNGHVNLEIPSSLNQYYIHPDYNFNLALKRISIFSSYNSEFIRFNQHESLLRKITVNDNISESKTDLLVQQNLWSHRFNYGIDYNINESNLIGYYGFYNPYSQEYQGSAELTANINENINWKATRNDHDKNVTLFNSLYYKHTFKDKGGDLIVEASHNQLNGDNFSIYKSLADSRPVLYNSSKPKLTNSGIKVDLSLPVHDFTIGFGTRLKFQDIKDVCVGQFRYLNNVISGYSSLGWNNLKFDFNSGLRLEKSISELKNVFTKSSSNILPFASFSYKISSDKTIKTAFTKTIYRPNLYQLNPNLRMDDPNTIRIGNPELDPEIRTAVFAEYSKKTKSNFYSVRIFFNKNQHAINGLTFLNDSSAFETRFYNLGTICQAGFQVSGTFKMGGIISLIPYIRLYGIQTHTDSLSKNFDIRNRKQIVVEPGFSSIFSFKHGVSLTMNLQYTSPRINLQDNAFSDPLYMISLDKSFKSHFKAGITTALPLKSTFTYQGSEIKSDDFYSRYTGEINITGLLLFFKLSYQFNSGNKLANSNHVIDESDVLPKRGI